MIIGLLIPAIIDSLNINNYGNITIGDNPSFTKVLQDSQAKGVVLGIYGSSSVNYTDLTPLQAREMVANDVKIFNRSGLNPIVFISPTTSLRALTPSIREAIESTGVSTRLSPLQTNSSRLIEYGVGWRDMKNFSDPRFAYESERMALDRPTSILIDAEDWNPFLKRLLSGYLSSTDQKNITVRVDDINVNTPQENVHDMDSMLQYSSVGRVVYAVTPSEAMSSDPRSFGFRINDILKFYWWFFVLSAFFPLLFFIFWRDIEKYRDDRKYRLRSKVSQKLPYLPFVSVIVPAYNEENEVRRCLDALTHQDYKGQMEVILVNDGSTDRTTEIVMEYPIKLIDLKRNVGKANALNIGLTKAVGEIIAFSDSDSFLANDAISEIVKRFEECPDADIVAGNVFARQLIGKGRLLRCFQIIEYTMEQYINRYLQGLKGGIIVCPGPLFAVKRHVTDKIKYSDKTLVEDADFTVNALKCKMKIIWAPNAKVYTTPPATLWRWYRQRKRWWYGNLQVWKLHNSFVRKNPWFILSYMGFVMSFLGIIMLPIPFILLLTQSDIILLFFLGSIYIFIAALIFAICVARFYMHDWKLLLMLLPYLIFYNTLKGLVVGYIYFCYIRGGTTKIQFGSKIIDASCSL